MRLFALQRNFDPSWTDDDFERMMRRAIGGLHWDPPVFWRRSYGVDLPGAVRGFCVYESDSLRTIREQQNMCWVPFTDAQEVEEACGAAAGNGRYEPPEGASLFLVERTFERPMSLARLVESNVSAQRAEVIWVRSYWDAERRHSRCVFAAPDMVAVTAALESGTVSFVAPVLEEHPSAWVDIYDQAGVPRSWEAEPDAAPV